MRIDSFRLMGLFSTLMSKVFGHGTPAQAAIPTPTAQTPPAAPTAPAATPATASSAPVAGSATPAAPTAQPIVDVAALLDGLAAKNPEKLDWKRSIVDLMKLVGMDSSLADRKELAKELHYPGDSSDSAAMNVWLHKEVLKKIAANGGKVPADLLD